MDIQPYGGTLNEDGTVTLIFRNIATDPMNPFVMTDRVEITIPAEQVVHTDLTKQ